MNTKKILLITAILGVAVKLGYDKYKDVSKLKDLKFLPGAKPFGFLQLKYGVAQFVLGLIIKNPSSITIDVNKMVIEAWYKGLYLGKVNTEKIVLEANADSPLNLPLDIIANKLLPFAKDFLTKGSIPVEFRTTATIMVLGKSFTMPYTFVLDVKQALRDYLREDRPLLAKLL